MTPPQERMEKLLEKDRRYKRDAYIFVREALAFAQDELGMGGAGGNPTVENHLTGQQLCEAIRRYALEQFGYMAKVVLASWGVHKTGDFGEIVYNLIGIGLMKKSKQDRREHFDDAFDFDQAFREHFEIQLPE